MTLEPGTRVWIRCEVKVAVFPDERAIRLESPAGRWEGVVDVGQLRDDRTEGSSAVLATVVESTETHLAAWLPGQARRGRYFTAPVSQFEPWSPI